MECGRMMADENITADADKKILFWYNETEYVQDGEKVYTEGAGQALFGDKRHILIEDSILKKHWIYYVLGIEIQRRERLRQ